MARRWADLDQAEKLGYVWTIALGVLVLTTALVIIVPAYLEKLEQEAMMEETIFEQLGEEGEDALEAGEEDDPNSLYGDDEEGGDDPNNLYGDDEEGSDDPNGLYGGDEEGGDDPNNLYGDDEEGGDDPNGLYGDDEEDDDPNGLYGDDKKEE